MNPLCKRRNFFNNVTHFLFFKSCLQVFFLLAFFNISESCTTSFHFSIALAPPKEVTHSSPVSWDGLELDSPETLSSH